MFKTVIPLIFCHKSGRGFIEATENMSILSKNFIFVLQSENISRCANLYVPKNNVLTHFVAKDHHPFHFLGLWVFVDCTFR